MAENLITGTPQLLTLTEVTQLLRRSKTAVMAMAKRGHIPAPIRLTNSKCGKPLWRREELLRHLGLS